MAVVLITDTTLMPDTALPSPSRLPETDRGRRSIAFYTLFLAPIILVILSNIVFFGLVT